MSTATTVLIGKGNKVKLPHIKKQVTCFEGFMIDDVSFLVNDHVDVTAEDGDSWIGQITYIYSIGELYLENIYARIRWFYLEGDLPVPPPKKAEIKAKYTEVYRSDHYDDVPIESIDCLVVMRYNTIVTFDPFEDRFKQFVVDGVFLLERFYTGYDFTVRSNKFTPIKDDDFKKPKKLKDVIHDVVPIKEDKKRPLSEVESEVLLLKRLKSLPLWF